jgi:hypothetical protein
MIVAGIFFMVRGLRKKLSARHYTLQDARAQGTMFVFAPLEDPETSPRATAVRFPLDADTQRLVRRAGRQYRAYRWSLLCQAHFEAQDTIDLPAAPPGTIRHTEPIRKCRLERDTEGVRSIFPPLRGEEPNQ